MKQGQTFKEVTGVLVRSLMVLLLSLGLSGCFATYSWHQKMTLEVKVDGQLYVTSSVIEVSTTSHPDWLPAEGSYDSEMKGEAVVLELPEKRYLFTLIKDAIFLAPKVFEDQLDGALSESNDRWAQILEDLQEVHDIDPKDYPLLVTFTDITDPKAITQVDPDNLAATFGSGVSLQRITLEITDEGITEGKIESVLGWLDSVNRLVEPKPGALLKDTPVEHRLYHLDFRRK